MSSGGGEREEMRMNKYLKKKNIFDNNKKTLGEGGEKS
jgi:hypothetical protein